MAKEQTSPARPRGRPKKTNWSKDAQSPAEKPKKPHWAKKYGTPKPDWSGQFASIEEDRLHIDPQLIKQLEAEGIALGWKVQSVFGQEQRQAKSVAQRNGWQYVEPGEIPGINVTEVDGLALMARPTSVHRKAKELEERQARARIKTMEYRHGIGDLPGVSLAPDHPTARQFNHHRRSVERIEIPKDE